MIRVWPRRLVLVVALVYSADRQFGDHARPVTYAMRPRPRRSPKAHDLFVHAPIRRDAAVS